MDGIRRRMFAGLVLAASSAFAMVSPASAVAPFSFDTAQGRLPKNVVPLDYDIAIVPNLTDRTLAGEESVVLDFRAATDTIQFNSLNEVLDRVRLDGEAVKSVVSSDEQQLTTVTLVRVAGIGQHKLTFTYQGKIESSPHGLFAQSYVRQDGSRDVMLSTQFEAIDARRMFPCWDEPAFRSTFALTVTVPKSWSAISNMPIASRVEHDLTLATATFERTPRMPTHLLEFSGGHLARIRTDSGATQVGLVTVRGQERSAAVALANAKQILADYNDYFGVPFPLPKLDSIAVPGGFTGAMENWGAITYNDQALLVTPTGTLSDRQLVFSTQAHEMAHQWNGDLVTMGWWDDIWLNESFASWMAARETALRNPDWNWWESADSDKEIAMKADARVSSHAIQQPVTNEVEATASPDPEITYAKGQSVLRMLEWYLGPDAFRASVRAFMKAHAYGNATSADLWNAMNATAGKDVSSIAAGWTEQPGFPLVSVTAACDSDGHRNVQLSQKRFLLRSTDSASGHWSVPLRVRVDASSEAQSVLLTQDGQTVTAGRCDEPLDINAGSIGYYRAIYDAATLKAITAHFGELPRTDRIALLDDQWALVQAGEQPLSSYLALAATLGDRLEERAWTQISGALGLVEYDERATPGHEAFVQYARGLIKPVTQRLGWVSRKDESAGAQNLRHTLLQDLGDWGDAETLAEARKRFASLLADHNSIDLEDQETVLRIVGLHADAATFDQLHTLAKSSRDETELRRNYRALMRVRDPQLAEQAARIALSDEIPPQAADLRLQLVAELTVEHPQLAWTMLTQNTDALMKPFPAIGPMILAQFVPQVFWDSVPPDQLEPWIKAHVPAEMAPQIARGMESARFKIDQKAAMSRAADQFLSSRPGSSTVSGGAVEPVGAATAN
jgi:aminopeptidase N